MERMPFSADGYALPAAKHFSLNLQCGSKYKYRTRLTRTSLNLRDTVLAALVLQQCFLKEHRHALQPLSTERREGIVVLLDLGKADLLDPTPNILLRIEVGRVLGPSRQHRNVRIPKCLPRLWGVHQAFAVEDHPEAIAPRESSTEERPNLGPDEQGEALGCPIRSRADEALAIGGGEAQDLELGGLLVVLPAEPPLRPHT
jgi:hypothetical protein